MATLQCEVVHLHQQPSLYFSTASVTKSVACLRKQHHYYSLRIIARRMSTSPLISRSSSVVCAVTKMAEVEVVGLDDPEAAAKKIPSTQGIYAVFDKQGDLQFVGMSRRISSSIQGHAQQLPHLCASVKVAVVDGVDKAGLNEAWQAWVEEHLNVKGNIPPGNIPGNNTWSMKKKKKKKGDLQLMRGRDIKLTIPLEELIEKVVKEYKVVAFIKGTRAMPACGFSHRVLTILNEHGAEYESVDVLDEEHNNGVRDAIKKYSQWPTIPQVFINGEFVGGADLMAEIAESGELKKLLDGGTQP